MTPLPKQVEIELYHTIGGIVIRYGFIDSIMTDICRILFEDLGGHPSQKKPPKPMSIRLEYICKCFRNKPELTHFKEATDDFSEMIKAIDKVRNHLVHGCLTDYFPEEAAFQFTKVNGKADASGYEQNSVKYTHHQLAGFAQACTEVVRSLQFIGRNLEAVAAAHKGQRPE